MEHSIPFNSIQGGAFLARAYKLMPFQNGRSHMVGALSLVVFIYWSTSGSGLIKIAVAGGNCRNFIKGVLVMLSSLYQMTKLML